MITVIVEKTYGASGPTAVRARITAATIERAVEMAGPDSRVVFPVEGEAFFACAKGAPIAQEGIDYASMSREEIEAAYEAGLPGAYDAYLDMLKDDLGHDDFEQYALENCLI